MIYFTLKGKLINQNSSQKNLEPQVDLVDLAFPLTLPPFPSPAMVAWTLYS